MKSKLQLKPEHIQKAKAVVFHPLAISGGTLIALVVVGLMIHSYVVKAEQSGSSPQSNATSRLQTINTDVTALGFGETTDTPDWGTAWNRIKTAAKWPPTGNAAVTDVLLNKTFYSNTRTQQTGTYNAANLTAATVKYGTSFGVGLTGDYPSSTNLLPGDTGTTDAAAGQVLSGYEGWDKTGAVVTGSYPGVPAHANQAWYDGYTAAATESTNDSLTWTASSSPATGDDNHTVPTRGGKDPRVPSLIWSKALYKNGTTIEFNTSSETAFSWDSSAAANQNITAPGVGGSRTAINLCADQSSGGITWRLPTQKELMQAYIDGSFWNLTQPSAYYWASTENSTTTAWVVNLSAGNTSYDAKTYAYYVRCVRPGP